MVAAHPVKHWALSFVGYWAKLYREHDKAIPALLATGATGLSATAPTMNGQGEPVVAIGMIFLSCVFAVLAAITWKGISKRSGLTRIIKIAGLSGFFIWSIFSGLATWRNRPKDRWTNITWDDVVITKSYLGYFLSIGWKPTLIGVALALAYMLGRRTCRPIQAAEKAKPFTPAWFLFFAERDKQELRNAVKVYAVSCETHFTDAVPYIDFSFGVFSMALTAVYIDDSIEPPIIFWPEGYNGEQHKMRRQPTLEVNHAKPCYFRWPSRFTIRQDVTPEEVALISKAGDIGFFRLAALKVTMHGEGFSGIKLDTDLTVKTDNRYWTDKPEYIFGGDPERDAILKQLYSLWEQGKILLAKAEDGTIEYLDRRVQEWETKTADYLAAHLAAFEKDSFLSDTNWSIFEPDPARVKKKSNARFLNKIYTRVTRLEKLLEKLSLGSPIIRG